MERARRMIRPPDKTNSFIFNILTHVSGLQANSCAHIHMYSVLKAINLNGLIRALCFWLVFYVVHSLLFIPLLHVLDG